MKRSNCVYFVLLTLSFITFMFNSNSVHGAVIRIALVVGNDIGKSSDIPLSFAQSDAQRIAELLTDLGRFDTQRIHLLLGKDKTTFEKTMEQIKGRISEIMARGDEALLLFYYSGHGSRGFLHLGNTDIDLEKLRENLKATSASIVIGIIDACHSGRIGISKGGYPDTEFDINLYDDSTPKGMVLICSSLADEVSQESLEIGGSLFTHYFMSALRGEADYDLDGRVTLQEAYSSSYHHTLGASVTTSNMRQHPLADIDLTGKGDLVLTFLNKSSASIFFSPDISGRYMIIQNLKNRVMAEITKEKGRSSRVALPPGEYKIYKQEHNSYLVTDLNLIWGGEHILNEYYMKRIPYQVFLKKGTFHRMKKNKISIQSDIVEAELPGMQSFLSYGLGFERFTSHRLSFSLTFSYSQQDFPLEDIPFSTLDHKEMRTRLLTNYHFSPLRKLPYLQPTLGLCVEYVYGWDTQYINQPPSKENKYNFQSVGFGPTLGFTFKLPGQWSTSFQFRELLAWTNIPYRDPIRKIYDGEQYSPLIKVDKAQNILLWNVSFSIAYCF